MEDQYLLTYSSAPLGQQQAHSSQSALAPVAHVTRLSAPTPYSTQTLHRCAFLQWGLRRTHPRVSRSAVCTRARQPPAPPRRLSRSPSRVSSRPLTSPGLHRHALAHLGCLFLGQAHFAQTRPLPHPRAPLRVPLPTLCTPSFTGASGLHTDRRLRLPSPLSPSGAVTTIGSVTGVHGRGCPRRRTRPLLHVGRPCARARRRLSRALVAASCVVRARGTIK